MDIYQNNLLAIKDTNNTLYQELIKIESNTIFEVFAQDNLENANILDTRNNKFVYQDEPMDEINKSIEDLNKYSNYRVLYFFGIGNGYLFKKLLQRVLLERITIIEPELELIYIALNLIDLSKEIKEKSILIYYAKDVNFSDVFKNMQQSERLYFKSYNLFLTSDFYDSYQDDIIQVNKTIIRVFSHIVNSSGNDCFDSLIGLKQFLHNLPSMISHPSLSELTKKAKISNAAIIVSTGPSLYKQLPLLKKIKDKAMIISLDASMPILELHNIKPDIVVTHERSQITSNFYKKTSKEFQDDITFVIGAVAHKELVDARVGGELVHYMRPVGTYFNFFGFDDWGYIGVGMSSANLAYELATKIGFEQIILIGQDLAYSKDGLSHSKDHTVGEDEWVPNENDDYIDGYGNSSKVRTMKWWKLFLNAFESYIALNNTETNIKTINATEGGAKIHGSIEMSFQDATDKYLKNNKKHFTLQSPSKDVYHASMDETIKKLDIAVDIGSSMQKKATKLLTKITIQINLHKDINIEDIAGNLKNKRNKQLLQEIQEIRVKYYGDTFQSFFTYLIAPLLTHVEFDIANIMILQDNTKDMRTVKEWKLIVIHHEWLLRIISNLKPIIEILDEAKSDYLKLEKEKA